MHVCRPVWWARCKFRYNQTICKTCKAIGKSKALGSDMWWASMCLWIAFSESNVWNDQWGTLQVGSDLWGMVWNPNTIWVLGSSHYPVTRVKPVIRFQWIDPPHWDFCPQPNIILKATLLFQRALGQVIVVICFASLLAAYEDFFS